MATSDAESGSANTGVKQLIRSVLWYVAGISTWRPSSSKRHCALLTAFGSSGNLGNPAPWRSMCVDPAEGPPMGCTKEMTMLPGL